jgi:hypothetical protein
MKTREEVVQHLVECEGYTTDARAKITGFLIGKGMKEPREGVLIKKGLLDWQNFCDWFTYERKEEVEEPITMGDVLDVCGVMEFARSVGWNKEALAINKILRKVLNDKEDE